MICAKPGFVNSVSNACTSRRWHIMALIVTSHSKWLNHAANMRTYFYQFLLVLFMDMRRIGKSYVRI